jgi:hypothetical protein
MSEEIKLNELEKIKKIKENLEKKQKEVEEEHKDIQFKNQLKFIINKVKIFLEIDISDDEVFALLIQYHSNKAIRYYISFDHKNLLLARKFLNRYARHHEIRYEDSIDIITEFFNHKLLPINGQAFYNNLQERQQYSGPEWGGKMNIPIVLPLFY